MFDASTKQWVKASKSEDDEDAKTQKVAVSKTNVVEMTQKACLAEESQLGRRRIPHAADAFGKVRPGQLPEMPQITRPV